jgi:hypothetical protein
MKDRNKVIPFKVKCMYGDDYKVVFLVRHGKWEYIWLRKLRNKIQSGGSNIVRLYQIVEGRHHRSAICNAEFSSDELARIILEATGYPILCRDELDCRWKKIWRD